MVPSESKILSPAMHTHAIGRDEVKLYQVKSGLFQDNAHQTLFKTRPQSLMIQYRYQ